MLKTVLRYNFSTVLLWNISEATAKGTMGERLLPTSASLSAQLWLFAFIEMVVDNEVTGT